MQKCLDLIVRLVLDWFSNCTFLRWSEDHQLGFSHSLVTPIPLSKGSQEKALLTGDNYTATKLLLSATNYRIFSYHLLLRSSCTRYTFKKAFTIQTYSEWFCTISSDPNRQSSCYTFRPNFMGSAMSNLQAFLKLESTIQKYLTLYGARKNLSGLAQTSFD